MCEHGGPISLVSNASGGGSLNYQWRLGTTNLSSAIGSGYVGTATTTLTLTVPIALARTAATYNVTATNTCGTGTSTNAEVRVNALPTGTTTTTSVCSNTALNVGLQALISNGVNSTFSWSAADNPNVTGESTTAQTGSSITNTLVNTTSTPQTVTYTVTPTSVTGTCAGSPFTVTVTVNPQPTITLGTPTAICAGATSFALPYTATGGSPDQYSVSGAGIKAVANGTLGSSLLMVNLSGPATAGNVGYSLTVRNATTGCISQTYTGSVTVHALPTAFSVTGGGSFCVGGMGVSIGLDGSQTGVSYQLVRNVNVGSAVVGTGNALDFGLQTTAGTYTVVASTNITPACTQSMTGDAAVSINPLPTATAASLTACSPTPGGTTVPFDLTSLVNTVLGGQGPTGYAVAFFTDNSLTTNIGSPSAYVSASGTVYAQVTNTANGCKSTGAAIALTVVPASNAGTAGGALSRCINATEAIVLADQLTGEDAGGTWSLTTAPGGGTYSHGNAASFTPSATGVVAGTYVFTYTVNGAAPCSDATAQVTVNVNALPTVSITGLNPAYCKDASAVTLTGSPANGSFTIDNAAATQLNPASLSVGAHTVVYSYTDGNGCTNTASQTVTIHALPTAFNVTGGGTFCAPSATVTLSGSQTGFSYQLQDTGNNNVNVGSAQTGTGSALTFTVTASGTYRMVATSNPSPACTAGMNGTANITLNSAQGTATLSGALTTCAGGSADLAVSISGASGTYTVVYTDGTSNFTVNSYTSGAAIPVSPTATTPYSLVSVTAANGCPAASLAGSATVTVRPLPTATIGTTTPAGCQSGQGTLTFTGPENTTISYTITDVNGTSSAAVSLGSGETSKSVTVFPNFTATYALTSVAYTDAPACSNSITGQSATVTVNPTPTLATVSALSTTVCGGQEVTFTASGLLPSASTQVVYSLTGATTGSGTVTLTTNASGNLAFAPQALALGQTTLEITALAVNGCTQNFTEKAVAVTVNALTGTPSFITPTLTVCQDAPNTTYTATAANATGISYTLSPAGAGSINASTGEVDWNAAFTGRATIKAEATGLCGMTDASVQVTVNPKPAPVIQANDTTPCYGTVATLSLSSTYSSHVWKKGNNSIPNATNATFQATETGSYTVTVTDANGCTAASEPVKITIGNEIVVAPATGNPVLCFGDNTGSLSVTASGGNGPLSYRLGNGTPQASGSFTGLTAGTYSVTISDENGCSVTVTNLEITQPASALAASITAPVTEVCGTGELTLTGSATGGTTAYTYAWTTSSTNGGSLSPASGNGATFTANGATPGSVLGTLTVTDANGCTGTATQTVTVYEPATANAGSPQTLCEGETANLVGNVGGSATGGTWTSSGTGTFGNASSLTTTYTSSAADIQAGSVTLTLTTNDSDGPCPAATSTVALTIHPKATVSLAQPAAVCQGNGAVTLTGTYGGSVSSLSFSDNGAGGTFGTLSLAGGAYSVSYTPAGSFSGPVALTVTTNDPDGSGPCPAVSDQKTFQVNPKPATPAGTIFRPGSEPQAIANTGTYAFCDETAGSANLTFTNVLADNEVLEVSNAAGFTNLLPVSVYPGGNLSNGTWYLRVRNALTGCLSEVVNVTIEVKPKPMVALNEQLGNTNRLTTCDGASSGAIDITVTDGQGPFTFAWAKDGEPGFSASTEDLTGLSTGDYTVTVTGNGCSTTATFSIVALPPVTFSVSTSDVACHGETNGSIEVTASGGSGSYLFSKDGGATFTALPQSGPYLFSGLGAGTYPIVVKDDQATACVSEVQPVALAEPDPLLANASLSESSGTAPDDGTICNGAPVTLTAAPSGGKSPYAVKWFVGATEVGTGLSLTVSPPTTTAYRAEVTDGNGCFLSEEKTITVNPRPPATITSLPVTICPGETTTTVAGTVTASGAWTLTLSNGQTTTGTGDGAFSFTVNPPNGPTTYTLTALTDANACAAQAIDLTGSVTITKEDLTKPTVSNCPAPVASYPTDAGQCTTTRSFIAPSGNDNCTPTNELTVTWAATGATTASGTGNITNLAFAKGTTTVTYTVTDAHGNANTCSFTVTVVDSENPTITPPATASANADAGKCYATNVSLGTPTVGDNCPGATVVANVGGVLVTASTQFPVGNTTVTWTVTDASGHTATATQTLTVNDTQKPVIPTPTPLVVSTDPNLCTAAVTVTPPAATDNCGTPTVTGVRSDNLALNAPYPKGLTTITWTATDAEGNPAQTTQTVTVSDNEAPAVPELAAVSGCDVTLTAPTTTDNCAGTVTGTTTDLTRYTATGTYTVTWTFSDGFGNSSQATQQVVVHGAPTMGLTATGTTSASASSANGPASLAVDVCAGGNVAFSALSRSNNDHVGALIVVSETSGNVKLSAANVVVYTTPVVVAPGNMTNYFSAAYGPYSLSSGAQGTFQQVITPFYDVPPYNGTFDAGEDCLGVPVTVEYTVYAQPVLSITNPASACAPGTVNLTAAAVTAGSSLPTGTVLSYHTNLAGTVVLANPGAVSSSGTYYVKATSPGGCVDIKPVSVTVNPAPLQFNVTGGGGLCQGGSGVPVGLSGSETGVSYQLVRDGTTNLGSPQTGTGGTLAFGNQTTTGTYTVVATVVATGCTRTMTGSVTVSSDPFSFTQNPQVTGPFCAGGSLTMSFAVGCSVGMSFVAELSNANGTFTAPAAASWPVTPGTNTLPLSLGLLQGTGYRVRVVASNPASTSSPSAAFTINALTVALYPATPGLLCQGQPLPVTFSTVGDCLFPGGNTFTVQLSNATGSFASPRVLGMALPGTTTFAASLLNGLPAGTGYRVRIVSSNPATTSQPSYPFELRAPSLSVTPGVGGVPTGGICRGSTVTVSFTLPTGSCAFPSGNVFTAQLSSASGSFTTPINLTPAVQPGVANSVMLPATVAGGTGYRIRIVSSTPVLTSLNGSPFRVNAAGCNGRMVAEEPELVIAPNPVAGREIHCQVKGIDNPQFKLISASGRPVAIAVTAGGEASDWHLRPAQQPAPGVYAVQVSEGQTRLVKRVLVVE